MFAKWKFWLLFRLFQPVFTVLLYMFSKSEVRPYTRTFDVTILSFVSNIFDLIAYRIGISQVLYYAKCENANFCKKMSKQPIDCRLNWTFSSSYCRFLCSWPHPYSLLIFGMFPLDQIADVGINVSRYVKLFGRGIIFKVFQPMWSRYLNVTDRRTDW